MTPIRIKLNYLFPFFLNQKIQPGERFINRFNRFLLIKRKFNKFDSAFHRVNETLQDTNGANSHPNLTPTCLKKNLLNLPLLLLSFMRWLIPILQFLPPTIIPASTTHNHPPKSPIWNSSFIDKIEGSPNASRKKKQDASREMGSSR